jgi:hypothetical protein
MIKKSKNKNFEGLGRVQIKNVELVNFVYKIIDHRLLSLFVRYHSVCKHRLNFEKIKIKRTCPHFPWWVTDN